jgi:hypothetical protein
MPGSFPGWIASVVHEFGFDRAKAAFHRGVDAYASDFDRLVCIG